MADFIEFWTPVGRMVSGNAFESELRTDFTTGKPKLNDQGQETRQFRVSIAIPKAGGEFERSVLPFLQQAAMRDFPGGQAQRPDFAWKFVDGDSTMTDQKGKRWCDKAGYPGNHVLRMGSGFAFQVLAQDGVKFLTDPASIKLGYWVRAFVQVQGNGQTAKAGLYTNIKLLQFVAYGEVINTGIDVQAAMRAAPAIAALPQGASAVPLAGAPPVGHQPALPAAAQSWPPQGWQPYPGQPGFFHDGKEALSEQQLRVRFAPPNPGILLPPIPGR